MRDLDPRENRRRACPRCARPIMALATLCGYCWSKVNPIERDRVDADTFPDTEGQTGMLGGETEEFRNAPRRPCPHCERTIMAAATLCGYCWTRVPALR